MSNPALMAPRPPPGENFSTLINPHGPGTHVDLSLEVQNITHITPAMLLHAPHEGWVVLALLCWVYQRCRAAGGARPTLIGHNAAAFDRLFLGRLAAYYGCILPPSWALLDTYRVAMKWRVQHGKSAGLVVSGRVFARPAWARVLGARPVADYLPSWKEACDIRQCLPCPPLPCNRATPAIGTRCNQRGALSPRAAPVPPGASWAPLAPLLPAPPLGPP